MMDKDLNYYLSLPWVFEFEQCQQGGYFARVKGLSCYTHGNDMKHATEMIMEALETYIEGCLEEKIPIQEPETEVNYNGRISFRTSKSLQRKMTETAIEEGLTLSQFINENLAEMMAKKYSKPLEK